MFENDDKIFKIKVFLFLQLFNDLILVLHLFIKKYRNTCEMSLKFVIKILAFYQVCIYNVFEVTWLKVFVFRVEPIELMD